MDRDNMILDLLYALIRLCPEDLRAARSFVLKLYSKR